MRDPKRIPKILKRLKKIWEKNPDLRLAQLIGNVYPCTSSDYIDPYYIEDEPFLKRMEEFYTEPKTFRMSGTKGRGMTDWPMLRRRIKNDRL